MKAVLTECSVDPALPDLLTRRGPLGHPFMLTDPRQSQGKAFTVIGSVNAVEGQRSPHALQSVSLPHVTGVVASYPVGYFGRNQLLGGSMGLSPLCVVPTSNLHVSIATTFH